MKKTLIIILGSMICIGLYLGIQYQRSLDYKATGVPVLNYHRVDSGIRHSLVVPPEEFKKQMQYLYDDGWYCQFMDTTTYEQVAISDGDVGEAKKMDD